MSLFGWLPPDPTSQFFTRSGRCNLLSYIPNISTQHFLAAGRGAAASQDAPAGAQSSICCKGRILPTRGFAFNAQYVNSKTTQEKLQLALNLGSRLLLWLLWARKWCCTTKVSKFCPWLSWTLSHESIIWVAVNKTGSSLRVSDRKTNVNRDLWLVSKLSIINKLSLRFKEFS